METKTEKIMYLNKRLHAILCTICFAILTLSFYTLFDARYTICFAAEEQTFVASVNGTQITEAALEKAIDTYIPRGVFHGNVGGQKRKEYRKPALDLLIEREILFQEAEARGMTVEEREIDKIVKETKERFRDRKGFEKALKASGMTLDEFKEMLRRNELINKFVKVEIEEQSRYSDKELEGYYNANREKFLKPEGFKIKHILIKVPPTANDKEKEKIKDKARDILKRAKAGEDFSELAYKYSEGDYRVKGGDIGWVHKGRLEPEIEDEALKLKIGEISGLIETIYGYHIVRLEEKKQAEQLDFSDVKDSLKKELESKRYKETKEAFINALKEKAKIEIYSKY